MTAAFKMVGGLALLVLLALAGVWLQAAAGLPVPGAILGLGVYLLLIATGRFDWTLPAAGLLTGLIGAMIVPALVGLAQFGEVLASAAGKVAMLLVVTTAATAVATALIFRLAGGRG